MRQERALRLKRSRRAGEDRAGAAGLRPSLCVLGLIDAALGRKDLALDEGVERSHSRRVKKMSTTAAASSIFRDHSSVGGRQGACVAATGSWTACSRRSVHAELRCLKLHPFWDPLRGDPRFEKIVASLAPK